MGRHWTVRMLYGPSENCCPNLVSAARSPEACRFFLLSRVVVGSFCLGCSAAHAFQGIKQTVAQPPASRHGPRLPALAGRLRCRLTFAYQAHPRLHLLLELTSPGIDAKRQLPHQIRRRGLNGTRIRNACEITRFPQSCRRSCSPRAPSRSPLAIPASSTVTPKLPNSCRDVVREPSCGPSSAKSRRFGPNVDRGWPNFDVFGHTFGDVGLKFCNTWRTSAQIWPIQASLGRTCLQPEQC